jgi:hypothetical protein
MVILMAGNINTVDFCGSLVVKALDYKPEGRGFEIRWGEILNLPNPSSRTSS